MIVVIDYGAGNLRSVANALDANAASYKIVNGAGSLQGASRIILPGVGHFGQMVRALDRLGLREALCERLRDGVPFLGICLGFQALFEASEEAPGARGLGLLPGSAKRFHSGSRVPHMGWNRLVPAIEPPPRLFRDVGREPYVYFAHSYYVPLIPEAAASCMYTEPFTAAVEAENLFGVQFHPEKSGPVGLRIVRNFVEL